MLASSGGINPIHPTQTYYTKRPSAAAAKTSVAGKYDSLTLSGNEGASRFQKDLLSRISQEVRTATTTGDIQALRQAVSEGTYTPDPMAIAAGMMLMGD